MCPPICLWARKSVRIFLCRCTRRMLRILGGCWITASRLEDFTITIHGKFMARCGIGFISSPAALAGVLILCFIIGLEGCRSAPPAAEPQATGSTYQLRGIVVSSDAAKGRVTIEAEAIPGFMGALTMPYKLAQPGVASELHTGDHVTARLRVSSDASLLDQIDVTAQAKPDYKPEKLYNVPAPGQT